MSENDQRKQMIKISVFITSIFVIFLSVTYAFINQTLTGTKRQVITAGNLSLELQEDENNLTITDAMPMYDEVGMIQDAFTFRLINDSKVDANYILKLEEISVEGGLLREDVKYGLTKNQEIKIDLVSNIVENVIDEGTIRGEEAIDYELRLWIKEEVTDISRIKNKAMRFRINIESQQEIEKYTESVLNGCDPILSDNLVPVKIEDDGTVKKASIYNEWYNYSKQEWANAVVLEDKNQEYNIGDIIPEDNIQSYFVWIPKYRYQLWDLGNYNGVTNIDNSKVHSIPIQFGKEDTNDSKEGECTTPAVSQSSGNCKVGDYMTHPAFQAFDSNGFWVGKFETGYKGATTTAEAENNNSNPSNLIIKPNVYSWRSITVGNMFKASYDYMRDEESHMMKNTEWGAVALLQHSEYGSRASVRSNNNYSYLTGCASVIEPTCGPTINNASSPCNLNGTDDTVTQKYNTPTGYLASTTGNITGIYDMAGGSWEYVMGYNTNASTVGGASEITSIYSDFFTNKNWERYYDKYLSTSAEMFYSRILGDATGEMGGFAIVLASNGAGYRSSSWYGDYGISLTVEDPWVRRGGGWDNGLMGGIFSFIVYNGGVNGGATFRVVLVNYS